MIVIIYLLTAQVVPPNPVTHLHLKPLIWSIQVPPFLHGAAMQSSISNKLTKRFTL